MQRMNMPIDKNNHATIFTNEDGEFQSFLFEKYDHDVKGNQMKKGRMLLISKQPDGNYESIELNLNYDPNGQFTAGVPQKGGTPITKEKAFKLMDDILNTPNTSFRVFEADQEVEGGKQEFSKIITKEEMGSSAGKHGEVMTGAGVTNKTIEHHEDKSVNKTLAPKPKPHSIHRLPDME